MYGAVSTSAEGQYVQSIQLNGRTLTIGFSDGATQVFTTQDTTALSSMTGILGTAHGGTGKSTALTAVDVGALASGSTGYIKSVALQSGQLKVTNGAGTVTSITPYSLPTATASRLGGIKIGSNLTVSSDGTVSAPAAYTLTAAKINTALGYNLADKLTRLERMMTMDGKLIYTGTGIANNNTHTMTIPTWVDYIKVRMARPALESSNAGVGVCSDYGVTNIVRGGSANAMVGNNSTSAIVLMTFAADGTLTIGGTDYYNDYPFNVEGYQYL